MSWHDIVRRLFAVVTSDWAIASGAAAVADATSVPRLQGTFSVHPLRVESMHPDILVAGDRIFTVYMSAIQYTPSLSFASPYEDLGLAAATSVFNLGLCHHLQAILNESRASSRYAKALRAYRAAQHILEGTGLVPLPSGGGAGADEGLMLLQMALANNVGHIYDQLHVHDGVARQLGLLHTLVGELYDRQGQGPMEEFVPFLQTTAMRPLRRDIFLPAPCA